MPKKERPRRGYLRGVRTEAVRIWLFWACDAKQGWLLDGNKSRRVNLVVVLSYSGIAGHERQDPFR